MGKFGNTFLLSSSKNDFLPCYIISLKAMTSMQGYLPTVCAHIHFSHIKGIGTLRKASSTFPYGSTLAFLTAGCSSEEVQAIMIIHVARYRRAEVVRF